MKLTKDACGSGLTIEGTLDINTADELRNASALQLLCSAFQTAERSDTSLAFIGVSDAILNAGAALGSSLADFGAGKSSPC